MRIFHFNICFIIIFLFYIATESILFVIHEFLEEKNRVVLVVKRIDFITLPSYVFSLLPEISFSQKIEKEIISVTEQTIRCY